jgi:hypothetical protein
MERSREKWREVERNREKSIFFICETIFFLLFFSLRFEFPDRPKYEILVYNLGRRMGMFFKWF